MNGGFFIYENKFIKLRLLKNPWVLKLHQLQSREFSFSGLIFSLKRRRLGEVLFSDLVYLKLNESNLLSLSLYLNYKLNCAYVYF